MYKYLQNTSKYLIFILAFTSVLCCENSLGTKKRGSQQIPEIRRRSEQSIKEDGMTSILSTMKTTALKFTLSVLAYLIPTMILGMVWHFVWFSELYDELGIYNREDPIIPLGFTSMLFQGIIIAYLYPYYTTGQNSIVRGLKFSLIMGFFLFTVSTLANAAKIEVTSMADWLVVQLFFHLIQFSVTGLFIGLVYRKA